MEISIRIISISFNISITIPIDISVYIPVIIIYPMILCWLVVSTPLKNMIVSWDHYSQYMESHKNQVPNHQPAIHRNCSCETINPTTPASRFQTWPVLSILWSMSTGPAPQNFHQIIQYDKGNMRKLWDEETWNCDISDIYFFDYDLIMLHNQL
jgi:hypothetical protein